MKLSALLICAGAIAAPVSAMADTIDVKYLAMGSGQLAKADFDGTFLDVYLGQLSHEFSNGTGAAALFNGNHLTFCTDISQMVTDVGSTYNMLTADQLPVSVGEPAMGAVKAQAIYDLFAVHGAAAVAPGADGNFTASFQAAIWEIVYDYDPGVGLASLDLAAGRVKLTNSDGSSLSSDVITGFNSVLAAMGAGGTTILGVGHETFQDQLFVPAPGSVALIGLGAFINRRRRA